MKELRERTLPRNRSDGESPTQGDSRVSVVFFRTAYDTMGGGTKMLLRLLEGLDKDRFDITLVSQRVDELCERVADLDITIEIVPFDGVLDTYDGQLLEMPVRRKVAAGVRLVQYNFEFSRRIETPDVLWCGGTRPFVTLLPYICSSETATIWNVGLLHESTGTMRYINDAILRTTDHIFIESVAQARRQLTVDQYDDHRDKFTVFHKGIDIGKFDPKRFDGSDKRAISRVGTAALINPRKGLEYFVDAAALVLEERSDIEFTIAGEIARENDERYKAELQQRIRDHGIENHVEFLGWVEDMPAYLNTLDVFVLPSYNEGIPGAVREALAMEVPSIATNVGGISDVVRDGETGLLVEPEDSRAIANGIDYMLGNRSERIEMGEHGREHVVDQFSMESYIDEYERFLERIS